MVSARPEMISKTSITMNRYSHARQDAVKKGMNALDEAYHL